ncbi:hypothetical protein YO5_01886 [Stutzerimonas stutzeri TS44]|nr:hypothetical protein YO5_01886 [Stutzerimonas stutzeri TS44]
MLGLLLAGAPLLAADVAGSADLAVLPRYPQAQIVDYRQAPVDERIYPQDSIRRISGKLRMASQITSAGQLTAVTYRLPDSHSGIEAFTQSRRAVLDGGGELLFWCEGRECGSSSLWANAVFGKSKLYGPEGQQAYLLARLPQAGDSLLALYGVTRGNGRSYLHVEQLEPSAPLGELLPNAATLLRQLRDSGELRLPRLPDEPSAEWSALLADLMRQDITIRVSLGGHAGAAWREALIAERIGARRIELDEDDQPGLRVRLLR